MGSKYAVQVVLGVGSHGEADYAEQSPWRMAGLGGGGATSWVVALGAQ